MVGAVRRILRVVAGCVRILMVVVVVSVGGKQRVAEGMNHRRGQHAKAVRPGHTSGCQGEHRRDIGAIKIQLQSVCSKKLGMNCCIPMGGRGVEWIGGD